MTGSPRGSDSLDGCGANAGVCSIVYKEFTGFEGKGMCGLRFKVGREGT